MDLNLAIEAHAMWKLKFRNAISNHETMDADIISKDDCCELGKWLHGEAKLEFSKFVSYTECLKEHANFHVEAGKVAKIINSKGYTQAQSMINFGTPFATASSATAVAILRLKKESGL